jgi:plastocyanin
MKKWLLMLIALLPVAVLVAACGVSGSTGSSSSNMVTVTTNATNFTQPSVTLKKGQTLQVTNNASDMHMLSLGRWQSGVARPEQEAGAPSVSNLQLNANSSVTIGPWNTPGTYYIYCTIHPNMMLKVTVQS